MFVNVFGGITACDAVANGIVGALKKLGDAATKPLVVRLDGNNVEEGRKILADFAHPLVTHATPWTAAPRRSPSSPPQESEQHPTCLSFSMRTARSSSRA